MSDCDGEHEGRERVSRAEIEKTLNCFFDD